MQSGALERMASSVTNWAEKWFPDSYIFAVLAVGAVGTAGALTAEHSSPRNRHLVW